ncbi:hypothetical protein [Actinopolymorpha pittospori]|uniref:Uncharacterized protein n=1 Tax=Actinopolymorpha pittospori TaxID=648752 RepID=A0A927RNC4_9ACTN|nr:hypothetical protein [Actinopolymorpha pittospori]MBE1610996.1 hypothetical protein [Actinopolymorpha pittospori]
MVLTAAAFLVSACGGGDEEPARPKASVTPHKAASPRPVLTPTPGGPTTPANYRESCSLQPQICRARPGAVPVQLRRPLHFPSTGQKCPVTGGRRLPDGLPFGGVAVGSGPVRGVLLQHDAKAAVAGTLQLEVQPRQGWYGGKTLWFSAPSYTGPVLLRGTRLDQPGEVAFGAGRPHALAVQIPPGRGVNVVDGYRAWTGLTWFREPGCYGIQVDGTTFSTSIVIQVQFRP